MVKKFEWSHSRNRESPYARLGFSLTQLNGNQRLMTHDV
jgi:hypothetical protein